MRKEKGITMIALVLTIIIMAILVTAAINYGVESLKSVNFQNFEYELEQIQGRVDVIYEKIKAGNESYITLGEEITTDSDAVSILSELRNIDYSSSMTSTQREKYYYNDTYTYYRYFSQSNLESILDVTSSIGGVIINFVTAEVYSVEGFTYDGVEYHSLSDIN